MKSNIYFMFTYDFKLHWPKGLKSMPIRKGLNFFLGTKIFQMSAVESKDQEKNEEKKQVKCRN